MRPEGVDEHEGQARLITILDYGMGNLRSVQKAIEFVGGECRVGDDIERAKKLVIPGVGAFGAAMERLAPLRKTIRDFAASGRPLLGICLGQQLLFEESEEIGHHEGLGLVRGKVRYLPGDLGLKVPHMGWSPLSYRRHDGFCEGGEESEQVYFVHSLVTVCDDPADVAATATYGVEFAAIVQRDNVWAAQFHPEKSSKVGLRMLRNFVDLPAS
ncbi:MAG TPA: imidazole glycerol phosphate synthase subunit HisH [Fimbriimonas sp.]